MLTINHVAIIDTDQTELKRVFKESDNWTDAFYNYVHGLINNNVENTYNSVGEFLEDFLAPRRSGNYLTGFNDYLHRNYNTRYRIAMSGNRTTDKNRAMLKASGTRASTLGYRWHHKQGIKATQQGIMCDMYLVQENYHNSHHHDGGVDEYLMIFQRGYGRL